MRPSTSILPWGLFIAATTAQLDISPPCISSCYDTSPGPENCEGVTEMTDEILARCTCSSFVEEPPLYRCIRRCPESKQATYIAGLDENVFQCREDFFPDITTASTTTSRTSEPTNTPSEEDDNQATTTSNAGPASTNSAGEALNRAAPPLLAGGLVVAALFF